MRITLFYDAKTYLNREELMDFCHLSGHKYRALDSTSALLLYNEKLSNAVRHLFENSKNVDFNVINHSPAICETAT